MKKFFIGLLFLIFYSAYMLLTQLIFGDNNLIPIKGELWRKYTFVKVEMPKNIATHFAYLTFYLKGDPHQYTLKAEVENVQKGNLIFSGVSQAIGQAGNLEILVRKGDLANLNIRVYQISADSNQVFNIPIKPANNGQLIITISLLALLFLLVYFLFKKYEHQAEMIAFQRYTKHEPLFV